jgi:ABC-type antimicrobial peptide transport system permease subunit
VDDQLLLPDLNPGGFITRPPLALTTLDAARFILGSEDVINAIRVRVAGVDDYSTENVAKVEKVAAEIVERTGLHVDIVAGSSPQKVLIFVPDLGFVEEQWTTLGAATRITSGINTIHVFLYSFLLLASLLFISNEAQIMIVSRRKEIGLLKAIGWYNTAILARMLRPLLFLGSIGAGLAALFAVLLDLALGIKPLWSIILLTSLLFPLIYSFSSIPFILWGVKKSPALSLTEQDF